jgi:leucyl-tRNA synthetase
LGSAIIMLAPLCPHISAELWAAFTSVKKKNCDDFLWDKSVFHQVFQTSFSANKFFETCILCSCY